MAIKMIVTDLDRTLLRDDKTISGYTAGTLEDLANRGIMFVIATARPTRGVRADLPWLKYDGGVLYNGALVTAGEKHLQAYKVDNALSIVTRILHEKPETQLSVEMDDYLYSNMPPESMGDWGSDYCYTTSFRETAGRQVEKILISSKSLPPEDFMSEYERFIPEGLYMEMSENTLIMVMNRQATKLNGIRLLAEHYGIGLDEVAAFGDDHNDVEMLRACGAGVAVANAIPEAKAAAGDVCPGNEEDGVARWIRANVLT